MNSFLHITNPFQCEKGSESYRVQQHTLTSLSNARNNARGISVKQVHVGFPDEGIPCTESAILKPTLTKSLKDFCKASNKKLPLLDEILKKGAEDSDEEYIIYSNMDIILSPEFYNVINLWLNDETDALIINRRRIAMDFLQTSTEKQFILFAENGKAHPGFDCFIFKKSLLENFVLGNCCVGIPHAETCLAHNIFAFSKNCRLVTDAHLTFHIGMELYKPWGTKTETDHNYSEFRIALKKTETHLKIENLPGSDLPFLKRHFKWLMNPLFHYPTMAKIDFSQWRKTRSPKKSKEKTSLKNKYLEWLIKKVNF